MSTQTCFTRVLKIVYKNILKKNPMHYVFKVSVNVLNKKNKKYVKIKGFFVLFAFHTWVLRDFPFFSCIKNTENSWRTWHINPPFCSHTEILWHELRDVSSWNEAVPKCPLWSKTRCRWDTAGSREAAARECSTQAFSRHIYAMQTREQAPSWLCFTCSLGC